MRVNVTIINIDETEMFFSQETINSFSLTSQTGLILPSAKIDLQIKNAKDLEYFREKNLKIKFDFGFDDKTNTYIFRAIETKIEFNIKTSSVRMFCLPIYRNGYLFSQINSFKDMNSYEIIPNIVADIGIDISNIFCDIETDDVQTWIQYNNKNYEFLREVIIHSNLSDSTDVSINAFTLDDRFFCMSYNRLMKNKPSIIIKDYIFNKTTIEIGNGEKDLILKEGTKISEFKLLDGERIPQNKFDFTLDKSEENSNITNDNFISYKINFGNTHPLYNFTPLKNRQRWYELENNDLIFELPNLDGSLDLLDIIEISLKTSYEGLSEIIDGIYFISGKTYKFEGGSFKTIFKISKRK